MTDSMRDYYTEGTTPNPQQVLELIESLEAKIKEVKNNRYKATLERYLKAYQDIRL